MFDARSILDALVKGGSEPQAQGASARGDGGLGSIGDLLKQLSGGDDPASADAPAQRAPTRSRRPASADEADDDQPPARQGAPRFPTRRDAEDDADDPRGAPGGKQGGGGGLEDIIRDVLAGGGAGGGLKDILERVQKGGGLGGLGDILGPVLGQVLGGQAGGPKGGAARLTEEQTTDLAGKFGQLTGRSPEELMAQIKDLIANNQFGTGMAAGGLGALVLGTQTGRSLAASAAKLGGLAVIGGLAYKAYMNYQQGTPAGGEAAGQQLVAPPAGSGFEPSTVTNDHATTMIKAMVAAAAADGRIDANEQQKLLASFGGGKMTEAAQAFLANEIANPASVDDLAAAVTSEEEAVQIYTAARITVDPDIDEEHAFLAALAERLGLDEGLTAHIDAAARGAAASV